MSAKIIRYCIIVVIGIQFTIISFSRAQDITVNYFHFTDSIDTNPAKSFLQIQEYSSAIRPEDKIAYVHLQNIKSYFYLSNNQTDTSEIISRDVLDFSKKINEPEAIVISLMQLSHLNYIKGNYFESLILLEEADSLGINEYDIYLCESLAAAYEGLEIYDKAYDYASRFLRQAIDRKDSLIITRAYLSMADVHYSLLEFDKALDYYSIVKNYARAINNRFYLAIAYNAIANCLSDTDQLQEAKRFYLNSYKIFKELKFKTNIEPLLYNLYLIELSLGDTISAIKYIEQALELSLELEDGQRIASNKIALGYIQAVTENSKGLELINEGLQYSVKNNYGNGEKLAYYNLTDYYEFKGDYENAFYNYINAVYIEDSLINNELKEKVKRSEERFEVFKKQKENELLHSELAAKNEAIQKQKHINYLYIIVLILILGLSVVIYVFYRERSGQHKIERKKSKLLEEYSNSLDSRNKDLNKLISVISHDLKSPFQGILGLSELLALNEDLNEYQKKLAKALHSSSKKTFELLNNLLDWAQAHMGSINFSPAFVNLSGLMEDTVILLHENLKEKNIILKNNLPDKIDCFCDENMIQSVFRNILTNAIKFSYDNSVVEINYHKGIRSFAIEIKDSGVGMTDKQINNLFGETYNSTYGTNAEKGTGLGLKICEEFIRKNNGEIKVHSAPGRGTSFFVWFNSDNQQEIEALQTKNELIRQN